MGDGIKGLRHIQVDDCKSHAPISWKVKDIKVIGGRRSELGANKVGGCGLVYDGIFGQTPSR